MHESGQAAHYVGSDQHRTTKRPAVHYCDADRRTPILNLRKINILDKAFPSFTTKIKKTENNYS